MMFESLKGKTVLITGSGAGIGAVAAEKFAQLGACVVLNSLSDSAEKVCQRLLEAGYSCMSVRADVSTQAGAELLVSSALERFGKIDVLINNAGIVPGGSVEQNTEDEWDHVMAVNAKSVFLMSRLCLPHLRKVKGSIINTTSIVAVKGVRNRAIYSASKGAVLSLSLSMAAEYISEGIRVNCVCPGTVYTPSLQDRINHSPDPDAALQAFIGRQPLGRLGKPEEIATAMVAIASEELGFLCGQNVIVDGGMSL
ncbi:SDR family NAD(P)-dependent oxidoreductase [Oscillibacter sp.]|uniref:SDR family NAD(P)-dependent oxidoreductase n=1 Tax=Oscillibacter sp. TaxID=1945593 RepID=UPI00260F4289|nr:glucose 1-dehydrogenase [Oscillibacter sp.]MDD3347672.1 glucose 1-dehydrogenase [Oscillibacter sp.]